MPQKLEHQDAFSNLWWAR